jgi:hypothetical protein
MLDGGLTIPVLFAQVPLVLMVIGTIVTTTYVTVIIFLLQFQSVHTLSLSLHTFFTCCVYSLLRSHPVPSNHCPSRSFPRFLCRYVHLELV